MCGRWLGVGDHSLHGRGVRGGERGGGWGAGESPEGQRESEASASSENASDWQVYGLGKVRGIPHNQVIFKNNLPA